MTSMSKLNKEHGTWQTRIVKSKYWDILQKDIILMEIPFLQNILKIDHFVNWTFYK